MTSLPAPPTEDTLSYDPLSGSEEAETRRVGVRSEGGIRHSTQKKKSNILGHSLIRLFAFSQRIREDGFPYLPFRHEQYQCVHIILGKKVNMYNYKL